MASGVSSHAQGLNTTASAANSHAEGNGTTASAADSHAEGDSTTASGFNSHAEGDTTTASGDNSHAEGLTTTASGDQSHSAGESAVADDNNAYVWSDGTFTSSTATKQYTVHADNGIRLLGAAGVEVETTLTAGTSVEAPKVYLNATDYLHTDGTNLLWSNN